MLKTGFANNLKINSTFFYEKGKKCNFIFKSNFNKKAPKLCIGAFGS